MGDFLQKLICADVEIAKFDTDSQIIKQGLAPLKAKASNCNSINLKKANLLEHAKLANWKNKAGMLFAELDKKLINFLVFKGFSYTFLLYNQTNIRPYSDIDILINQKDYDAVSTILAKLNYKCYPSRQGQFISFQNSFYDNSYPKIVIDLHWQISNRIEFHKYFSFNDLYSNSILIGTDNIQFRTINTVNAFIHGCFHYQAHRVEDRKHIWLYDLALIWNKMNLQKKQKCIKKSENTKQAKIVQITLKQLDKTFVNCLNFDKTLLIKNQEATAKYLTKRNKKITDIRIRLKNIKGLKNKLKFISEYILQSQEYVISRYSIKNKRFVFIYYPRMWVEDILRLFK